MAREPAPPPTACAADRGDVRLGGDAAGAAAGEAGDLVLDARYEKVRLDGVIQIRVGRRPMGPREGAHRPPRLLLFRSLGLDPPNRIEHDAGRRDRIAIEPPDAHHAAPGPGAGEGRRVLEGEQRRLVAGHLWRCTSASSVKRSISLAFSHSSSSMRFPRILLSRGRFRDRCD